MVKKKATDPLSLSPKKKKERRKRKETPLVATSPNMLRMRKSRSIPPTPVTKTTITTFNGEQDEDQHQEMQIVLRQPTEVTLEEVTTVTVAAAVPGPSSSKKMKRQGQDQGGASKKSPNDERQLVIYPQPRGITLAPEVEQLLTRKSERIRVMPATSQISAEKNANDERQLVLKYPPQPSEITLAPEVEELLTRKSGRIRKKPTTFIPNKRAKKNENEERELVLKYPPSGITSTPEVKELFNRKRRASKKKLRAIATSEKRSRNNDENQLVLYSRGNTRQDEMEKVLTGILGSSKKIKKKSAAVNTKKTLRERAKQAPRNHLKPSSTGITLAPEEEELLAFTPGLSQKTTSRANTGKPKKTDKNKKLTSREIQVALTPETEEFFRRKGSNPETFHWLQQNFLASDPSFAIPRHVMYDQYLYYCLSSGTRAVTDNIFGQFVHRVFPNTKMRRLGGRQKAKYHHCGIKIREDSTLRARVPGDVLEPVGRRKRKPAPRDEVMKEIFQLVSEGRTGTEHDRDGVDDLLAIDSLAIVPREEWLQYLGKHKRGIVADLERRIVVDQTSDMFMGIPFELTVAVEECRAHFEDLMFAVEDFKLEEVLTILDGFWHEGRFANGRRTVTPIENFLTQIETNQDVMDAITKMEVVTYDQISEILLPNVLRLVPQDMLQAYETFLMKLRPAVEQALSHHAGDILKKRKLQLLDIFINEMKMRIHITTSAEADRKFLADSPLRAKLFALYEDFKKIDLPQLIKEISYSFPTRDKIDEESSVKFFDFLTAVSRDTRNFFYFADWMDDCIRKRFENVLLPLDRANNLNVSEEYFKMEKEWIEVFRQIRMNLMDRASDGLQFFLLLEDLFRNYLHLLVKKKSAKRERIPCIGYDVRNEFDLVCLAEEELQQQ